MSDKNTSTREQIIQAASDLIENKGYHATGMNEIVKTSGAPKGSIYYYFPEGKDEITAEAVTFAGCQVVGRIHDHFAEDEDPASALQHFLEMVAHFVELSGFQSGGPLTIVAAETATTSDRLNQVCRDAYSGVIGAFQAKLQAAGLPPERSAALASLITSTSEGAIILSRTYRSGEPLRTAARELGALIQASLNSGQFQKPSPKEGKRK